MGAPAIPYAGRTIIALAHEQFLAIRRTVEILFRIAHSAAYQRRVDGDADAFARAAPGNFGVFMGYDFHVTPAGPRLIEVNTNAGGALLNGLHTASLCDPARLACLCSDLLPVEEIQQRIVRAFVSEFEAVRGARVYQGQVTNLRSASGGFSAICVARAAMTSKENDDERLSR